MNIRAVPRMNLIVSISINVNFVNLRLRITQRINNGRLRRIIRHSFIHFHFNLPHPRPMVMFPKKASMIPILYRRYQDRPRPNRPWAD